MFNRLINLYRIQKLYGLIRDLIEQPQLRGNKKHWEKIFKTALLVKEIQEMLNFLKGSKTYIIAALAAAVTVAHMLGYIDEATRDSLLALLMSGGAATVAAKINRVQKTADSVEVEVIDSNKKK